MAVQWTTTDRESLVNGIKLMVYGGPGVGKTVLSCTAPGPMIISAESGLLSTRKHNLERVHGINNPTVSYNTPVAKVGTLQDLKDVYEWCIKSREARQFYTISLDSLSDIAETILVGERAKTRDGRQAYGGLVTEMMDIVKKFRDLPQKNVLFIAKQEMIADFGGINKVTASFPGKELTKQMPYFFDGVFYLGVAKTNDGTDYRYLLTQPQPNYDAKDRSGALALIEPPDLTYIFRKMLGV